MGQIIAGMASSHAYALADPSVWDKMRETTRARYKERYGVEAPVHPKVAEELPEIRRDRYDCIAAGFDFFRDRLRELRPDALIVIGDDQNENFREDNLPQIAIYTGAQFYTNERNAHGVRTRGVRYPGAAELAEAMVEGLVEREIDVAFSRSFPNDELLSHAHSPILRRIVPDADLPIVPLFVNAIHVPALTPHRCYRLGAAIREVVLSRPAGERVALYASGGLSHFTAGYPWKHYSGPHGLGSISEELDRQAIAWMEQGRGDELGRLTSQALIENGDIELRSWITLMGAIGNKRPTFLHYEPFYSAVMAMGIGYWEVGDH